MGNEWRTVLRNMRRFYQTFPIRETVSLELIWTQCCALIPIEKYPMNGLLIKAMQLKNADELSVVIEQGLEVLGYGK